VKKGPGGREIIPPRLLRGLYKNPDRFDEKFGRITDDLGRLWTDCLINRRDVDAMLDGTLDHPLRVCGYLGKDN
jgi:hypothetical protein